MTVKQMRELAAYHDEQAAELEKSAAHYETASLTHGANLHTTASAFRHKAQFHTSSAIHLREMADGLAEALALISKLQIQP